jgi:pilus assembly protein Flp/PilA
VNLTAFVNFLQARLARNDRGASLVEYVLLVALIAAVCIGAITILGHSASSTFTSVGNAVSGAGS